MKIIAITGTIGAGKNTLVDFLKKEGYEHFSVRHLLIEKLKEMQLEPNRDNMVSLANDMRRKFGPAHLIELLVKEAQKGGKNAVIESIRTLGEVSFLKLNKISLWAVDAERSLRYGRILKRGSSTDQVSFEKFKEQEKIESRSNNYSEQNLSACIKKAEIVFQNDDSLEEFEDKVGLYLAKFQKMSL